MSLRQPNPVLSRSFKESRRPYAPMPNASDPQPDRTEPNDDPVAGAGASSSPMTMEGTVNKTGFLLVILSLAAAVPYFGPAAVAEALLAAYLPLALATVGLGIAVAFHPMLARRLAPVYAVVEGLLLGVLSRLFDASYPGIASQALMLTIGVAGAMLLLYRARIIEVTRNFRIAVTAATLGICIVYLVSLIGRFVGFEVPLLHENSGAGILVSLVIVAVAAANLALDFDFIERGVENKLDREYEWIGAFGLVVTLAWLYLEMLRLLAKLRSRN